MQHVLPGAQSTSGCLALKRWGEFFTSALLPATHLGIPQLEEIHHKYPCCVHRREPLPFLQTLRCHIVSKGHKQSEEGRQGLNRQAEHSTTVIRCWCFTLCLQWRDAPIPKSLQTEQIFSTYHYWVLDKAVTHYRVALTFHHYSSAWFSENTVASFTPVQTQI